LTRLAIIVAAAENGGIGRDNGTHWQLPEELRHVQAGDHGQAYYHGAQNL